MKETDITDNRRRQLLFGAAAAVVAVPFAGALFSRSARAEELPHLSEDDAMAKGLKYTHDATTAQRADKGGVAGSEQFCHNCMFVTSDSGDWRPCQLFQGKTVNANGWCVSWSKRPS